MRIALVIGNGFTLSLTRLLEMDWCPSSPLAWPARSVQSVQSDVPLLADFPDLAQFMATRSAGETDFAVFERMVGKGQPASDLPLPRSDTEAAILDAGHYLTLAFSQFQLQLDELDLAGWHWLEWFQRNQTRLVAVLSWNYDLLFELAWAGLGRPYFYPSIPGVCEGGDIRYGLTAIPVCKPHGSCNFEPAMSIGIPNGDKVRPLSYPRQVHLTAANCLMRVLPRRELLVPRTVPDIILPGELNRFGRHLQWVDHAMSVFTRQLQFADHLVVAGFSMGAPDRDEFVRALGTRTDFKRISVVDPNPSGELVDLLRDRCQSGVDLFDYEMPV